MRLVDFADAYGNVVGVAENKKEELCEYLELIPKYDSILKVLLFGSSLSERCNSESDIDLLFVFKGRRRDFRGIIHEIRGHRFESLFDDLIYYSVDDFSTENPHGLLSVVKRAGVVIYDCEQGIGKCLS